MKKFQLLLAAAVCTILTVKAQNKNIIISKTYPQGYFRNPLNIPMDASGTFGELRSTHFHAGDDYRTQQKIGLPLYAAAEGHISRVRVQIGGGGNAVYIDHPNGYTTVYLHMDRFNNELTKIVRAKQYELQRFDVDIYLDSNQLKVAKGQYIGNAGNTGGSAGPHLHFEIRDTKTQRPLNPQLFGLKFTDHYNPTIGGIMLYDLNQQHLFNEFTPRKVVPVKAVGAGKYVLQQNSPLPVSGKFGFGINAIDRHRAGGFQNGVYSIELFIDGQPVSSVVFEELDFNHTRGIHSYIDYPYWKRTKTKYQKSFKDPGNPIEIFRFLKNDGVIELSENKIYEAKYVVKDVAGNCSELDFKIQNNTQKPAEAYSPKGDLFHYNNTNSFSTENIKIEIPKGSLYTDLDFVYKEEPPLPNTFSALHKVHNTFIPLFSSYSLAIKPNGLPQHLQSKALIASTENGAEGGKYEDGWVKVNTRNFGNFYITVDTVPPTIIARNLINGKNVSTQAKIDFTIRDNLSGIQSFDGYIDGKWVLMEYDSKNRHLWHRFESSLSKGEHTFKLIVKDWKDNETVYQAKFIR